MKKFTLFVSNIFFLITLIGLLALGVRGYANDPNYYHLTQSTAIGGPFEASNSTSRYALVQAMVDNHTFFFNDALARFGTPDIVKYNGHYFSIFTPGVSILGIPFYLIGKLVGVPQIATYLLVALSGIINVYLVMLLAVRLGSKKIPALLSGLLFLFATNAFSYVFSFTQHHLSVTVILLALLACFGERKTLKTIAVGVLFIAGGLIDIPNLFMMFPMVLYILSKYVQIEELTDRVKVLFNAKAVMLGIAMIPLLLFFGYYNYTTTGSYTKMAQLIGRSEVGKKTDVVQLVKPVDKYDLKLAFDTRSSINGIYILLISNERSWIYYSPIVLMGLIGYIIAYRNRDKKSFAILVISVITVNIIIYSMFGDPWGGWAFGPRYLIPAAALFIAGLGVALTQFKKNIFFMIAFAVLAIYSVYVNTLGVVTTSSIPPKQEAEALKTGIPYTYKYNQKLALDNKSSSFVYNSYGANAISLNEYITIYSTLIIIFLSILTAGMYVKKINK